MATSRNTPSTPSTTPSLAGADEAKLPPVPTIRLRASVEGQPHALPIAEPTQVRLVGTPRRVVLGGAARDAGTTAPINVQADEVVRVEYDNGLVMWTRADDLLRERGQVGTSRSADGQPVWDIDSTSRVGIYRGDVAPAGDRAALALGIKVLEFFGVQVTRGAARKLGEVLELKRLGGNAPGLYRVALGAAFNLSPVADGQATVAHNRPVLLLLHGTLSSCQGSYGDLWASGGSDGPAAAALARQALAERFGDQAYAWEHRSLSESPIRNALALAKQLPVGAQLHLVSHSRGGLVGELLCLAERDRQDDPLRSELLNQLFAADATVAQQLGLAGLSSDEAQARDASYAADRAALAELVAELDRKQLRVRRFVRVACPARGTTLASGRLDRWLSVLDMLVPNSLFGDAVDFLLAVVKERTDPRSLPGIEAMMPGSALTRLLHQPALRTAADLSVIAGDVEGKGLWGQLKLLAVDWFYGSDHDLVVNTGSMVGGIQRLPGAARLRLDQGDQVNHFRYFSNKASIQWLADGLLRADGSDAGYLPITAAKHEEPRWRSAVRASRAGGAPRPLAVLIPGTMGSALSVRDRQVWLSYWALLKGGLGDIGADAAGVQPTDLLDNFYGPLLEHLSRTHRVEIFPYDWRHSVRDAAAQLAAKLEDWLPEQERQRQPVHLVAHSMGGLVARAMIADGGAGARAWQRITALPNSRLLMLGTPNRGSHEAVRWLTGFNPTEAKLILLDFTRGTNGIIDVVRQFPGLAELLPFDQSPSPWGQVATWRALKTALAAGFPLIDELVLKQANTTWRLLRDAAPDPAHMLYVAGCQPATVINHQVVDETSLFNRQRLQWTATGEGDGTVSWASGKLAEVPMYYAPDTAHDELCANTDDSRIFRGYVDLLQTGKTDQLPATPPARSRAAAGLPAEFVLPDLPITDDLPDEAAVRSMGFGGRARLRRPGRASRGAALKLSVRHGDLSYARHPVLVGHYLGDTIVSAEAALDDRMRGNEPLGPLSRQRDLGLYPGLQGSHAVFFNERPTRQPDGAIVVGLGPFGDLSPSRLETSVRDALLDYALRLLQRCADRQAVGTGPAADKPRITAGVSALLVGIGASSLRVRDSVEAIVRGTLAANRRLEDAKLDHKVLIDELEFVELYEDIAVAAATELGLQADSPEFAGKLNWSPRIVHPGEGRRQRSRFDTDASWWQRIEILDDRKADQLRFTVINDRARAEETLSAGQLRLADGFIAEACGSAANNPNVAKTLFEMLLPMRLKESAPDQRDIVLLVDEASARFPWELLEDRWSRQSRPTAVVSGVVRQLKTAEFRAQPAHATDNTVFVVGNPNLNGWRLFADLPGARREAERVHQVFGKAGYLSEAVVDASAADIMDGLHHRGWRVLHLAGHGEHDFELVEGSDGRVLADGQAASALAEIELPDGRRARPVPQRKKISGMVIGQNTFLTPGDVAQMRYVPELVFINCCHLGNTGGGTARFNKLAANLGVQFIRMGVRAVVCAGWAVDDAAALTFADSFYSRLLGGDNFGDAVKAARTATWAGHPQANTWGAYQCYGDPDYRLVRDPMRRSRPLKPPFTSPSELVTELRNLAESTRMRSKDVGDDDSALQADLVASVERKLARLPEGTRAGPSNWLARADVCASLGFAYGEARLFEQAVGWLNQALKAEAGDCPVRAAEQCANFSYRLAAQDWARLAASGQAQQADSAATQVQRAAIAERIERALAELDVINERAPTAERMSLLGGACKRLAWVQQRSQRVEALLNMGQYYERSYLHGGSTNAYPFTNWAVACLLLLHIDEGRFGEKAIGPWLNRLASLTEQQAATTRQALARDPSIWEATGLADLLLVQLLMAQGQPERCKALAAEAAEQYASAFARGASLREVASVQEHLDFLQAMVSDPAARWSPALASALGEVRRAI